MKTPLIALACIGLTSCGTVSLTGPSLEQKEAQATSAYIAAAQSFITLRSQFSPNTQAAVQTALDDWLKALNAADVARRTLDTAGVAADLASATAAQAAVSTAAPAIIKGN